jgi:small subunit ribosomal protein S14
MGKEKIVKKKKFGRGTRVCRRCGNARGLIRKYDLYYCRRCFREIAQSVGFKKYM